MNKYNLTIGQNNIYMVDKFSDNNLVNNITGVIKIKENFNIDICKKVLNKLVENCDSFRLQFFEENGNVYQMLKDYEYFDVDVLDIDNVDEYLNSLSNISFELLNSKLYDFKILKSGVVVFRLHHIISDAWTMGSIITLFSKYYLSYLNNTLLDDKVFSYLDHIDENNKYLNSDKYLKDKEFFDEYLSNVTEAISISESINKISNKALRYNVKLDNNITEKINEYCKINKVSVYALFMGAISTYLYRTKDKNDFVIGTPILNRSNFKEKQTLGMFVSTMPTRVKIQDNIKFIELLNQISLNNLSLFRHQKYPITDILSSIHNTNNNMDKLFNVVLSYQNIRGNSDDMFNGEWIFSNYIQNELEIHIMDINDENIYTINYDYLQDLFSENDIKYLHTRVMSIIYNAINDIDVNVDDISIMSNEENMLLCQFNNTITNYPKDKTVIDLFEDVVNKYPDKLAVVFEDKKLTYKELNDRVNSLANYLVSVGVNKNDVIGLVLNRSVEMIISILGVIKAGAAYLPIDTEFPEDRVKYMLDDSNAKFVITDLDVDYINKDKVINILDFKYTKSSYINLDIKPDNLIYIMYTSGTTGRPKGVKISHKNVVNLVYSIDNIKELSKCNSVVSITKYIFDMFVIENIVTIVLGNTIILANENESKMPNKIAKLIEENNVDIMFITPSKLNLLLDDSKLLSKIKNIKKLTIAGEMFPVNRFKFIKDNINADIYNGYGPTETTVCSSVKNVLDKNDVTIGKPLNNTFSYIVDKNNKVLPINVKGELIIGGNGVSCGYLNNEQLNTSKFILFNNTRFYKTGDLAKYNFNGELICNGRIDNQIKINGQRVELEEIEKCISSFNNIKQTSVVLKEKLLICFYTASESINTNKLIEYLQDKLPEYMIPKIFKKIDSMPITSVGKIDKKKLNEYEYLDNDVLIDEKFSKDQIDIIELLKNIKNDIKVGLNTNFFETGIDSLDVIKFTMLLNEKYNIDITPQQVINNNTVLKIEKVIKSFDNSSKETFKVENKDSYILSSSQKGLFTSYLQNMDNINYNTPFEIELNDKIDVNKLIKCINTVINNYEVFSYTMLLKDNNIYQKYNKDMKVNINFFDIKYSEYLDKKANFIKPFDLITGPLYKIQIYKTEEKIYILCDFHHIIFDGASIKIFLSELVDLYEDKDVFDNEKISFGALCDLSENNKNKDEYIKAKEYYINKFSGELPVNNFVMDRSRPNERTFNGEKISAKLDKLEYEKIKDIAINNNITMNNIFLSMFNILLSKYMYSEDIILGIATLGRNKLEELNSIGMFVKTIPFRTNIDYNSKIIEYVKNTQDDVFDSIKNSIYTYEDLLKDLNIARDNSRNPLFDIMFVYQNKGIPEFNIGGYKAKINECVTNTSKFDLTCEVIPNDNNININLEYSKDLFNKDMIERLANHYINILSYFANYSQKNISDIEVLSSNEKNQIFNEFNNTMVDYPSNKTVYQIFEETVNKFPNRVALVFEDKKLTYNELNEKANQLANHLINEGIKVGDNIGIMIPKSFEMMIAVIAILKVGACYLPIELDYPKERIDYMIKDANVKYILNKENTSLNSYIYEKYDKSNLNILINSDSLAYIMYTSGTTGKPKGVMISHKNILRLIINNNYISFYETDRILQTGSIAFDASTFEYYAALFNGLPLYLIKKEEFLNVSLLKKYIDKNKITIVWLTTALFNQVAELGSDTFENVRVVLTGGEVFSVKHLNMIKEKCKDLIVLNFYGPTENTTYTTCHKIDDKQYERMPIGEPNSNNTCYIIDKCNKLCGINIPGELLVGGDGVSSGYLNRPDLTDSKFINNIYTGKGRVYKTGDLCSFINNGKIDFLGRIDSQVKIRGFRIELPEIAKNINNFENVNESFVTVFEENDNKKIVAYYTANCSIDIKDLKLHLKNIIPNYMIPSYFERVDKIPLNTNGKVDKIKLPSILDIKSKMVYNENEELTGIYKKLSDILKKIINIDYINIDDNLFEIGLDSLMATTFLTVALSNNLNLSYADIFKYPTIKELGDLLDNGIKKDSISKDIDKQDYTAINNILKYNKFNEDLKYLKTDIGNILLTGVTGFLGAHILNEYMKNYSGKIYCLVRSKDYSNPTMRIKEKLNFFFGDVYDKEFNKRIFVVEGDITNKNLVLDDEVYKLLVNNVDMVVNSAAHVKHYGDLKVFEKINVDGTKNIVDFCLKNNKKLLHVSTLSVSGNILEGGQVEQKNISNETLFDETKLFINQNLDNVYAYTKFMAEKYILDNITKGLDAKIMRMGNLTGRFTDGKYQPNVEENAFSNRIKTLVETKIMPKNIYDNLYLEFTPIDFSARAILLLSSTPKDNNMFHLYNNKHVKMIIVLEVFKKLGIDINVLSNEEFSKTVDKLISNTDTSNKLDGIIADLNSNKELSYLTNIIVSSIETDKILKMYDFEWPYITEKYIIQYIEYLKEINFLNI